jgi:hypothetical protein
MDPFDQFEAYATIADQLINELSKPQVAECARMLALHVPCQATPGFDPWATFGIDPLV